jgi:DNA replication and repair protein RecF
LDLAIGPGLTVFVGENAQGKSNLIEAIALLALGKSFRSRRDGEMIREHADRAVVRGDTIVRGARTAQSCTIARRDHAAQKRFERNGRSVTYAKFLGNLRVVTFAPVDLQLVAGGPALRRAFLNEALAQQDPAYYQNLVRYQSALRQKNALLRAGSADEYVLVNIYNQALAESGARLMCARRAFVEELRQSAARAHARWSPGEQLDVRYEPDVVIDDAGEDDVRERLAYRLERVAEVERLRRTSMVGPQRDEMALFLDQKPLGAFGSQGQQRTAVLALKIGEYQIMRDRSADAPLLLLDDVLSELDERRAAAFLEGIGEYEQVCVTSTHVPSRLPRASAAFRIERARVSATAC